LFQEFSHGVRSFVAFHQLPGNVLQFPLFALASSAKVRDSLSISISNVLFGFVDFS